MKCSYNRVSPSDSLRCAGGRFVFLWACFLFAGTALGEEPFGLSLMRPECLAGWDHGAVPRCGWTMVDGVLAGTKDATELLSGFTAGEVEYRFRWSVADGGEWKIALPEVPDGEGLVLVLCEASGCGRLTDGPKRLARGTTLAARADSMHTARLRRADGKLTVWVDGKQVCRVAVEPARRFGLAVALLEGRGTISGLRAAEPAGQDLLRPDDDLGGRWTGDRKAWRVENDQLVLKPRGMGYLRTKKEYANFTLSFEYQIVRRGNSGFGIRTPTGGWPSGDGLEMQILDRPASAALDEHAQMAIYGNVPPLARTDKPGRWNRVTIKADGWMISAWVNGELVQQFNTLHHPELKHRRLKGWIGPQDHLGAIRFRNLRLREAPDGTGLAEWSKPRRATAAGRIVDRLMNTESLSRDDGIRSAVTRTSIAGEKPGEHVLANLTGPGAVVRFAGSNDRGRLAFYFDGETSPRLACPPSELYRRAPQFSKDRSPVLSYLAYEKSLKIVLRDTARADYRIDYVTFPDDLPVETFRGATSSLPRGWLEAARYRQHVARFGTHRENDAAVRARPERKTIAPGATETLARVDGAGLVRWLKLRADQEVLRRDDLWLEITLDGESRPAIAAPARFLLPGFVGGGNYYNFVLVRRNGLASLLAMPFGNGLTVAATNHGDEPIENVGIEICYEPATDRSRSDILRRRRLRGRFLPATDRGETLFRLEGTGRWVGLVCEVPDDTTPEVAELVVDGQPATGWAGTSLAEFLGCRKARFRRCLSGRQSGLAWRYLLLAPVDFKESLVFQTVENKLPKRLVLYYSAP